MFEIQYGTQSPKKPSLHNCCGHHSDNLHQTVYTHNPTAALWAVASASALCSLPLIQGTAQLELSIYKVWTSRTLCTLKSQRRRCPNHLKVGHLQERAANFASTVAFMADSQEKLTNQISVTNCMHAHHACKVTHDKACIVNCYRNDVCFLLHASSGHIPKQPVHIPVRLYIKISWRSACPRITHKNYPLYGNYCYSNLCLHDKLH